MICKAIYVSTGKEILVEERLKKIAEIDIINPCQTKLKITKGKKTTLCSNNLLKGYLLIKAQEFTSEIYHKIKQIDGVIQILKGFVTKEELHKIEEKLFPVLEVETKYDTKNNNNLSKEKIQDFIENARKIYTFPLHLFKQSHLNKFIKNIKFIIKEYNNYNLIKYLQAMLI